MLKKRLNHISLFTDFKYNWFDNTAGDCQAINSYEIWSPNGFKTLRTNLDVALNVVFFIRFTDKIPNKHKLYVLLFAF